MTRTQHNSLHRLGKSRLDHSKTRCIECGSDKTFLNKGKQGVHLFPAWRRVNKDGNVRLCVKCYQRRKYRVKKS